MWRWYPKGTQKGLPPGHRTRLASGPALATEAESTCPCAAAPVPACSTLLAPSLSGSHTARCLHLWHIFLMIHLCLWMIWDFLKNIWSYNMIHGVQGEYRTTVINPKMNRPEPTFTSLALCLWTCSKYNCKEGPELSAQRTTCFCL